MTTAAQARELNELLVYTQQQVPSFSPQCFLLEKAGDFKVAIENNLLDVSKPGNTSGGKKAVPVRQLGENLDWGTGRKKRPGEPSNLKYIQKITNMDRNNYERYFTFTPAEIAQMAHYMSVTEALTTKQGKTTEKPIMNTDANLHDITDTAGTNTILRSNALRHAAGIESITADLVGIDSFTKKQVYLNAKFFFQDIKTMLSEPYAGLFKLETSREVPNTGTLFRTIDFHLGWKSNSKQIKNDIEKLNLTIRTHLVKYTFDVRQDGSIVADATYRGYYIEGFSGPQANLLEIAKTRFLEIKKRQNEINNRTTTVTNRNAANVSEAQRDLFILSTARGVVEKYFADREAILLTPGPGGTAVPSSGKIPPGGADFIDVAAAQAAIDEINGLIVNQVSTLINNDSNLAKSALSSADFNLPAANRLSRIKAIARSTADFGGVIQSLFGANLKSAADYHAKKSMGGTQVGGPQALRDDLFKAISDKSATLNTNVQTSQSNIRDAKKFAFDEQIRLASLARLKALQVIGEKLVTSDDIYYASIPRDVVRNFKLGAASAHKDQISQALGQLGSASAYVSKKITLSRDALDEEKYQIIPFVFLGNLIENMLNVPARFDEATFEPDPTYTVYDLMKQVGTDVKIDLGLLSYNTPYTGTRVVNLKLYYMPISLEELNNFFTREVLSKGKMFYSFNQFISDLLKKFLTGIFSSCAKESNAKALGSPKVETTIGNYPEDKKRTTQYFIHGAKDTINDLLKSKITPSNFGHYRANLRASIPHFFVFGRTKGIEKSVKLTDIADDQLKMAQYYSPRSSLLNDIKGNEQLKQTGFIPAVFQTEVQTIGFPIMNIGQLIYVDLKPTIGKNLAKSRPYDASGYYGVHKVSHNITKDDFTTSITAILQISDKDREIVKIGGLGNIEGNQEGATRGAFITTASGLAGMNSAWAAASTVATPTSTASTTTPAASATSLATTWGGVPTNDVDWKPWYELMVKGVAYGWDSPTYQNEIDNLYNTAPTRFAELKDSLEGFKDVTDKRSLKLLDTFTFQNYSLTPDFFVQAGIGVVPSSGVIPGMNGIKVDLDSELDKFVNNFTTLSKATKDNLKNELQGLSAEDKKLFDGTGERGYILIRVYDGNEVSIQFVEEDG